MLETEFGDDPLQIINNREAQNLHSLVSISKACRQNILTLSSSL